MLQKITKKINKSVKNVVSKNVWSKAAYKILSLRLVMFMVKTIIVKIH